MSVSSVRYAESAGEAQFRRICSAIVYSKKPANLRRGELGRQRQLQRHLLFSAQIFRAWGLCLPPRLPKHQHAWICRSHKSKVLASLHPAVELTSFSNDRRWY